MRFTSSVVLLALISLAAAQDFSAVSVDEFGQGDALVLAPTASPASPPAAPDAPSDAAGAAPPPPPKTFFSRYGYVITAIAAFYWLNSIVGSILNYPVSSSASASVAAALTAAGFVASDGGFAHASGAVAVTAVSTRTRGVFFGLGADEVSVEVSSPVQGGAFVLALAPADRPAINAWAADLKRFGVLHEREARSPVAGVSLARFTLTTEDAVCAPVVFNVPAVTAALSDAASHAALVDVAVTDDAARSGWAIGGRARSAVRVTFTGPTSSFGAFSAAAWGAHAAPWVAAAVALSAALGTPALGIAEVATKRIAAARAAEAERRAREEREAAARKLREEKEKAERDAEQAYVASLKGGESSTDLSRAHSHSHSRHSAPPSRSRAQEIPKEAGRQKEEGRGNED